MASIIDINKSYWGSIIIREDETGPNETPR